MRRKLYKRYRSKRRRYAKRSFRRYSRVYRSRRRSRRGYGDTVHIVRSSESQILTAVGPSPYFNAQQFMGTDPVGISNFLNGYAQFRINAVVVIFTPAADTAQFGVNQPFPYLPIIGWVRDFDDANPLTTLADMQKRRDYKETPFNRPVKIKIIPAVAQEVYASAATSAYVVKRKQWIRANNADAKHYGLKWCVYQMQALQNVYVNVRVKYYMSFSGAI